MSDFRHYTFGLVKFLKSLLLILIFPAVVLFFTASSLLIVLLLFAADILSYLNPWGGLPREGESGNRNTGKASIIIPNWNGRDLLERCLPSIIKAVRYEGGDHEIIVVDNNSTDDSVAFIQATYPEIKVIELPENKGFAGGCNVGVQESKNDIVVLLNNDMVVDKDFLRHLLNDFVDDTVFAVSSQIFFWDPQKRREETGKTRGFLRLGFLQVVHDQVKEDEQIHPVLYAGGGSSAFDKRKFLALGGFDELFHPFYWEDTDISYRAWKRGWRVLYEPQSVVYHKHRGTIGKVYDERLIHKAIIRNHFLFMWKNFTDPGLLLLHIPMLMGRLAWNYLCGNFAYLAAFISAVGQIGKVLKRRAAGRRFLKLADKEVVAVSSDLFQYKEKFVSRSITMTKGGKKNILFICPYMPCVGIHAGAGRMYTMIKLLAQRHRVSVVTFMDNEDEAKYIPELKKYCCHVIAVYRHGALGPRKRNPLQIEPPVLDEFYSPQLEKAIYDLLAEEDFDIVQAEYIQMTQYVPQTRRSCTIFTDHEVAFAAHLRAFKRLPLSWDKFKSFVAWMIMLNFELKACKKFDKVVAVTDVDRFELLSYKPDLDVVTIPTGVDSAYFSPQDIAEEPNTLIFVGYFKHFPNIHGILTFCREILPLIRKEIPTVKLYVVGASPPEEVQRLAEDERIVVTGWVEDLRPYIARSTVFVAPLWLGVGIRGKIFEAWGMEKPVVTTSVGSQGIVCTPGEDLLVADDPQGFAAHTIRLLRDKSLREKLGRNGRRRAETQYDWEIIIEKVERLYDEALANKFGS